MNIHGLDAGPDVGMQTQPLGRGKLQSSAEVRGLEARATVELRWYTMNTKQLPALVSLIAAMLLGAVLSAALGRAVAEPQPALDRAFVERLVRAQETQARHLEALARTAQKCAH